MSQVTIYTTPGCPQCHAMKRHMSKRGIEYQEVNMALDDEARQKVMDAGFRQAPVTDLGDGELFYGFRPDRVDSMQLAMQSA